MQDDLKIISHTPEQTKIIGREIGKIAFQGCVIALCGELGSGKTVFVKGLAEGLEVDSFVTSPTFVLINEYSGRFPLYHIDVYRLESEEDMYELGYEEYFYGNGVTAIEWAQKISSLLPQEYLHIEFEYLGETERQISLVGYGENYARIIKKVKSLGDFINYDNTWNRNSNNDR